MGIQSWKRGVHTGNTIRAGGSGAQNRCLGSQSGLVKRQVNPPSTVTAPFLEPEEERKRVRRRGGRAKKVTRETERSVDVEELEELEENVFYSLNKKGRWNLPEMIRTEIKNSKYTPKGQSEVRNRRSAPEDESKLNQDLTMVQCHSMKRGSNCFSITSTKLPGDGTVSKTKNYLNANSILQKKTRQRMRPNKKQKKATPQVEKAQEKPTTEIEISSPFPSNSYMQYAENARNSRAISKDTRQSPRSSLSSEEIGEIVKTEAYCDNKYRCIDGGDWAADESRVGLTTHSKDRKGDVKLAKTVVEPEEDAYVWFLGECVQMPCSEFQDDSAEEEGEEGQEEVKEEENENLGDENVRKKAADVSFLETTSVSEESEGWELLENEVPSEGEQFQEGDYGNGILAMLIEDALVRKTTRLQITQEDARIKGKNKGKNKKRKQNNDGEVNLRTLPAT